jgi:hypothetical protein
MSSRRVDASGRRCSSRTRVDAAASRWSSTRVRYLCAPTQRSKFWGSPWCASSNLLQIRLLPANFALHVSTDVGSVCCDCRLRLPLETRLDFEGTFWILVYISRGLNSKTGKEIFYLCRSGQLYGTWLQLQICPYPIAFPAPRDRVELN